MIRTPCRSFSVRALTSLLLLGAFLLLGFCPLRNTLAAIAHPAGAAPKVPVYGKIIVQDDCLTAVLQKTLPTSEKMLVPPLPVAWLAVKSLAFDSRPALTGEIATPRSLTQAAFTFPLYLRNRCLLI